MSDITADQIPDSADINSSAGTPEQQEAAQTAAPAKKPRRMLRWAFNKAADSAGRAAVTTVIKVAVLTTLAGIGASSYLTIGATAAAAGAGSALYAYGKDTFLDWRAARREGRDMEWWNKDRARKVKIALLTGAAGGAFGAWLAGTETFQHAIGFAKEYGGKALSAIFNASAHHAAAPVVAPVPPLASAADVHVHIADSAAQKLAETVPAPLPKVEDVVPVHVVHTVPVAPVAPVRAETPLQKMIDVMSHSKEAHGKIMRKLLKIDASNMKSVSPQFLKDSAHEILRMKDISWTDRLSIAHALGAEAQARGNHQAISFMKDLAKLENGTWKPHDLGIPGVKDAVHHAATPVHHAAPVHHETPVAKPAVKTPVDVKASAEVKTPVAVKTPDAAPDAQAYANVETPKAVLPQPVVTSPDAGSAIQQTAKIDVPKEPLRTLVLGAKDLQPNPAAAFHEAATCTISLPDPAGGFDAPCVINNPVMQPGDYVAFVARENAALRVTTPLVEGSSAVPTEGFLNAHMVADGVQKITLARTAAPKP